MVLRPLTALQAGQGTLRMTEPIIGKRRRVSAPTQRAPRMVRKPRQRRNSERFSSGTSS